MLDNLLLFSVGLFQDAHALIFGVLARLVGFGLGLGNDLVGGALGNDKGLGNSGVVALAVAQLGLQLGDLGILFSQDGRINGRGSRLKRFLFLGRSRDNLGAGSRCALGGLKAQTGNLIVHLVDLGGNALQEHVHFVNVVATTLDLEALVLDIGRSDGHVKLPLQTY